VAVGCSPCRAVRGCLIVILGYRLKCRAFRVRLIVIVILVIVAILDPLRDIAVHIMEAEIVGRELAYGVGPAFVVLEFVPLGVSLTDLVSPGICRQ
jgi:hypothetical protein